MTETEVMSQAVEFWKNYRNLIAEGVFFGVLAANALSAFLRWFWSKITG